MSAPLIIDIDEFARGPGEVNGCVKVSELGRLRDVLADTRGELAYAMSGRIDADGNPRLRLGISGTLELLCQRCLRGFVRSVDSSRELRLVSSEALLREVWQEAADVDDVLAMERMDVLEWVEDEIILGLPMSPRHEGGACPSAQTPVERNVAKSHPFAALAGLRPPAQDKQDSQGEL
jgi:uncharacterized protein